MKAQNSFALLVLLGLRSAIIVLYVCGAGLAGTAAAQQKNNEPGDSYLMGNELKFEMVVHIWGEVRIPGEYRVKEQTNLLELISKAGGPTEFSNLANVRVRRDRTLSLTQSQIDNMPRDGNRLPTNGNYSAHPFSNNGRSRGDEQKVLTFNMNDYLKGAKRHVPMLHPGDVVVVSRNRSFKWQTVIRIASQVAIIANVWYYLSSRD